MNNYYIVHLELLTIRESPDKTVPKNSKLFEVKLEALEYLKLKIAQKIKINMDSNFEISFLKLMLKSTLQSIQTEKKNLF